MNKSKGFSIIELVIVIVIIGTLSAFAIPKYIEIRSDARVASIQTAFGAIKAASAMVHALYLAPGGTPTSVTMDNISINIGAGTQYGDSASMAAAAGITFGALPGNYYALSASAPLVISIINATTPGNCAVSYVNGNPPAISIVTTGC